MKTISQWFFSILFLHLQVGFALADTQTNTADNPPSHWTHGLDISHHQGTVDWQKVFSTNAKFIYLKATDGVTYLDPSYLKHIQTLSQGPLFVGAYHFFEPKDKGQDQATHFLKYFTAKGMLPPVLDVEVIGSTKPQTLRHEVMQWLSQVEASTKCKPIIYTNRIFWEKYLGNHFKDYPLWLADYANTISLPTGVNQWAFWQHTQTGRLDGISVDVDLNFFSGDEDELRSLLCS